MCLKEIRLCAQSLLTILRLTYILFICLIYIYIHFGGPMWPSYGSLLVGFDNP